MSGQVSLKLLFDKETKKLVYGEAGKDFVDFLLTILSLPLGTVTKLLAKKNMVGCLGSLYQSIEDLNDKYIIQTPYQTKSSILNPKALYTPTKNTSLLPADGLSGCKRKFYTCPNNHDRQPRGVTEDPRINCVDCNKIQPMDSECWYRDAANSGTLQERGFVKGAVRYMVMDNLEVMPMSTVSIMAAFSRFNVKDVSALEEKVIWLSSNEGLKLLQASLTTQAVLSTVFLEA